MSTDERQSGAELEITPQMIAAGFAVLTASGLADDYSRADKCTVAEIFLAMDSARKRQATGR